MSEHPETRIEDRRVSEAYRTLAIEQAPEHLNRKMLKMAAGAATPYARSRAWMRPAAWAATIALSFALVLELNQVPSADPEYVGISSTADKTKSEMPEAPDDDAAVPPRAIESDSPQPLSIQPPEPDVEAKKKSAAVPSASFRESLAKEDFAARETAVIREAKELARAQAGPNKASADSDADEVVADSLESEETSAAARAARRDAAGRLEARQVSLAARGAAASLAAISDSQSAGQACAASLRETPDAWLACIDELRERGEDELADTEYEEFRRVFPEFDDSVTDK